MGPTPASRYASRPLLYEKYFSSKDTIVHYENVFVPKTRLETRIEYKIHRDTIRLETRVEVQRAKASKQPNYLLWIFLIVLVLAGLQLFKKFL